MGIVFLVVVLYILITTGLLSSFTERLFVMVCTASALSRGVIIRMIMSIWQVIIIALTVAEMIAFAGSKKGAAAISEAKEAGEGLAAALRFAILRGAQMSSLAGILSILSLATVATYLMTNQVFPNIPLICETVSLDVGYSETGKQATAEEFYAIAGSRTMDCWDMFGGGQWDPLWGQESKGKGTNPRTCFIIDAHLKPKEEGVYPPPYVTLKDLYEDSRHAYDKKWKLGSDKIYAYCNKHAVGDDFNNWTGEDCQVKDSRLYIMYFDKHGYDLISYGSSACNIKNDWFSSDVTDESGDRVVWCLEKLT